MWPRGFGVWGAMASVPPPPTPWIRQCSLMLGFDREVSGMPLQTPVGNENQGCGAERILDGCGFAPKKALHGLGFGLGGRRSRGGGGLPGHAPPPKGTQNQIKIVTFLRVEAEQSNFYK